MGLIIGLDVPSYKELAAMNYNAERRARRWQTRALAAEREMTRLWLVLREQTRALAQKGGGRG